MSWYNVRHPQNSVFGCRIHRVKKGFRCDGERSGDTLPYAFIPKPYTRNHPYPEHTMRIPILKRERAACILQRKAGLPINMISKFLGRSTSWVYRTLRLQIIQGNLRSMDMRKLPGNTRIRTSGQRWRKLLSLWSAWEAFLLGEEDKPP